MQSLLGFALSVGDTAWAVYSSLSSKLRKDLLKRTSNGRVKGSATFEFFLG